MFHGSEPIGYRSTNGSSEVVDFGTAVLRGQSPDRGLYMPTQIPGFPSASIKSVLRMGLPGIAAAVVGPYTSIPPNKMEEIMYDSFNFDIPLEYAYGRHVMRMDRGPTLSFKDIGIRPFARMMQHYLEKEGRRAIILTATSGDTGSAGADAFYGLENIIYVVLFPEDEISVRQRKLMTTLAERKDGKNNVFPIAVAGKFDDCQVMEKRTFADPELAHLNLSTANSINIGRLLPQAVQYFYAYSKFDGHEIVFSVPCGNFGHLTAGLMARRMGLPVYKFIAAVNENDEFTRYLETGKYKPIRPSKKCISNSMNVGDPSNLRRIVALYGGKMDESGNMFAAPDLSAMRNDIFSTSVSDNKTRAAMRNAFKKDALVLEPHGAVAWVGAERFLKKDDHKPCVVFETAHPWKFPEEVKRATGIEPDTPDSVKGLDDAKERYTRIKNGGELKQFLLQLY